MKQRPVIRHVSITMATRRTAGSLTPTDRKSVTVTWLQSTSGAIWHAPLRTAAKLNRRAGRGSVGPGRGEKMRSMSGCGQVTCSFDLMAITMQRDGA